MAVKTITKVYGVDDFKMFPITQDDLDGFACGEAIDGVGVKQVSITFEADEKDLTGDEMTLDTMSKVKSVTISTELAKLNLEAMELFTGGNLTTDEDSATLSIGSSASGNQKYFQAQFQIKATDNEGGDLHYIVYKAKATSTPINGTEDDYATFTVDLKGVYTAYDKFPAKGEATEQKLVDIKVNKTITPLAAVVAI
jgi:type VI protein secretion system component Hcp